MVVSQLHIRSLTFAGWFSEELWEIKEIALLKTFSKSWFCSDSSPNAFGRMRFRYAVGRDSLFRMELKIRNWAFALSLPFLKFWVSYDFYENKQKYNFSCHAISIWTPIFQIIFTWGSSNYPQSFTTRHFGSIWT